jgi:hypothetical protein
VIISFCVLEVRIKALVEDKREQNQDGNRDNESDIEIWKLDSHNLLFPALGNIFPADLKLQ